MNVLWAGASKDVFVVKATLAHPHNSEIARDFRLRSQCGWSAELCYMGQRQVRGSQACQLPEMGLALTAATPPGAPLLTRTRALVMQNIVGRFARTKS